MASFIIGNSSSSVLSGRIRNKSADKKEIDNTPIKNFPCFLSPHFTTATSFTKVIKNKAV